MTFTIGFDLDMTLIDPRPGMVLAMNTLVATGPCDAAALRDAGAAVVLSTLDEFPAWLRARVAACGT